MVMVRNAEYMGCGRAATALRMSGISLAVNRYDIRRNQTIARSSFRAFLRSTFHSLPSRAARPRIRHALHRDTYCASICIIPCDAIFLSIAIVWIFICGERTGVAVNDWRAFETHAVGCKVGGPAMSQNGDRKTEHRKLPVNFPSKPGFSSINFLETACTCLSAGRAATSVAHCWKAEVLKASGLPNSPASNFFQNSSGGNW